MRLISTGQREQPLHTSQKSGLTGVRPFATFQPVFMQSKLLQSLMRPDRLRRGAAIFLLAFAFFDLTVVDIFSPQLCGDEQVSLSLTGPVDSTEEVACEAGTSKTHDPQPDQDSHQSPIDEDCFCCCSHIIPSPHVNVAALNCPPQLDASAITSFPLPPPRGAFHPPRLS